MGDSRLFSLEGRVAVVTGAGRGLGRVLVRGLASAGAAVAACDLDLASAQETVASISTGALAAGVDVTSRAQVADLVAEVEARFGRIDIWINNAAVDVIEPALEVSAESWGRILDVDLTAAFFCAQAAARRMAATGGGSIINITSLAATAGIANLAAYSAAKAGLAQVTRVMALELAPLGVRVNAIAPGYLDNIMLGAGAEHADPAKEEQIRRFTPMGRRARLEELVGPAVFLASEASSYVTGAVLAVDGGYTAV